jgi:hypothetical protein
MAARLFEDIINEAIKKGKLIENTVGASQWFRAESQKISEQKADPQKILVEETAKLKRTPNIGEMYLFKYNPLYSKELPYYDTFPLIFPFKKVSGGFYGINMHYLPLDLRAKLMDGLYSTVDGNITPRTKLQLSYNILSTASRLRYFKPCVKHYLNSRVQSRFLQIPATQWDIALFLPLERFQKQDKVYVHRESARQLKGR